MTNEKDNVLRTLMIINLILQVILLIVLIMK